MLLDTQDVESVAVGLTADHAWDDFARSFSQAFPSIELTNFAELGRVYYQNSVNWLKSQYGVIQLIILFIVVLGILSTVSFTVLERTQELSTMRANGESQLQIVKLLIIEAIFLGLMAALIGVLAAYLLNATVLAKGILMPAAPGITRQYNIIIELRLTKAMEVLGLACLVTTVAMTIAGIRSVRLSIADGLRIYS